MIRLLYLISFILSVTLNFAQVNLVNKGAVIKVGTGVNLKTANTTVTNKNAAQINNNGVIFVELDYIQNTTASYTGGTASWLWFEGNVDQNLTTDVPITLSRLKVDNGNSVILNNNLTISTEVSLSNNGSIQLGTNNLIISPTATISNYDVNSYVISNGTGYLEREVGAVGIVFPIGNSTFNPATLTNSGTVDNFQVRITDQVLDQGTLGTAQTSNVVDRTWMISEETIGGSNLTTTLQWNTSNEVGFDRTISGITHHITAFTWDNPTAYVPATNAGINTWTQTRSGFTTFSPFVVRDLTSTLPVELIYFDAKRIDNQQVQLDWSTASELNNKGFEIERMLYGETNFETINFVEGFGNSNIINSYQYIDPYNIAEKSFYRLRQIDFDGTYTYSEVRSIDGLNTIKEQQTNIKCYPNPTKHNLLIQFGALPKGVQSAQIVVHNASGKKISQLEYLIQSNETIQLSEMMQLTPSIYLIEILLDNGEIILKKVIKS